MGAGGTPAGCGDGGLTSRRGRRLGLVVVLLALSALVWGPGLAQAATTFVVNTNVDQAGTGNPATECNGVPNDCAIRQALDDATSGTTLRLALK